jgi:hypothetical protein
MIKADSMPHLFSLHGQAVRLRCGSSFLNESLNHLLGEFAIASLPPHGASAVEGFVRLYQEDEVVRRLPASAARVSPPGEPTEVYQHDELYWLIDDRWGMAEINLLKGQWRTWILPQPSVEAERCLELAIVWPLAQLLRGKGLSLVPAVSCVRDGWGVLIVGQGSLEPELTEMIRAGYRVVGQRWTALRDQGGRVSMFGLPGKVQRVRDAQPGATEQWVDLTREFCGASAERATCDAVLLVDRGRRPVAHLKSLPRTSALVALRRAWPIMQLHAQRKLSQLLARLARECKCFEARFSRAPKDVLRLLDDARYNRAPAVEASVLVRSSARRVVA